MSHSYSVPTVSFLHQLVESALQKSNVSSSQALRPSLHFAGHLFHQKTCDDRAVPPELGSNLTTRLTSVVPGPAQPELLRGHLGPSTWRHGLLVSRYKLETLKTVLSRGYTRRESGSQSQTKHTVRHF